jgi:hypothetical protein
MGRGGLVVCLSILSVETQEGVADIWFSLPSLQLLAGLGNRPMFSLSLRKTVKDSKPSFSYIKLQKFLYILIYTLEKCLNSIFLTCKHSYIKTTKTLLGK